MTAEKCVSNQKDMAAAERVARQQGWEVTTTGGNHLKWKAPGGKVIYTSRTPSDSSGVRKALNDLNRAGLVLEDKKVARRQRKVRPVAAAEKPFPLPGLDERPEILVLLEDSESQARNIIFTRARYLLNLSDSIEPDEVAIQFKQMTTLQQEIALDLLSKDDIPNTQSPCGRIFQSPLFTEMHRRKCYECSFPTTEKNELPPVNQSGTMPTMTETPTADTDADTTDPDVDPRDCKTCGRRFVNAQARGAHESSHQVRDCRFCNKSIILSGVGAHEKRCDGNPERLKVKEDCPHCGKTMQKRSLSTHIAANCAVARIERMRERTANPPVVVTAAPVVKVPAPIPQAPTPSSARDDEYFDTLLNLVTDGRPIPFSIATARIVNDWIEATRKLLALVDKGSS